MNITKYKGAISVTRLGNGAYQISAMISDPFTGARLETQTYYGYTKEQSLRKYKAHLIGRLYRLV